MQYFLIEFIVIELNKNYVVGILCVIFILIESVLLWYHIIFIFSLFNNALIELINTRKSQNQVWFNLF